MTVVFDTGVQGPAAHALVVGVGAYPHLLGGTAKPLFADHNGLDQLSSPPVSARAFASWLIPNPADGHGGLMHPDLPLGSVRLLLSEAQPTPFVDTSTGDAHAVDTATGQAIEDAVLAWKALGDADEDNLLLFYYCGHGLRAGTDVALLGADFGGNVNNPLQGALDLRKLRLGMKARCNARRVCYFVDACRAGVDLSTFADDYAGRVPILPGPPKPMRLSPTFYSTLDGAQAYAQTGQPSHFTAALLQGLRGAGSAQSQGDWRVDANLLSTAIQVYLQERVEAGSISAQVAPVDDLVPLPLHRLDGEPEVPVSVTCDPETANALATLSYEREGGNAVDRPPADDAWDVVLEPGTYAFRAEFGVAQGYQNATSDNQIVYPPTKRVRLPVQ